MDEERAHRYEDLKTALLIKFDISPETYRQRFCSNIIPPGESPTETYYRLKGLYRRWLRPEQHTKDEMGEAIILEQLIRVLPGEVRTWVREHEPADGLAAAKLVSQYFNARKGAPPARSSGTPQRPPLPSSGFLKRESNPEPPGIPKVSNLRGAGKDFLCYYCQQPGHKASVCPIRKAKVTGACYAPRLEAEPTRVQPVDVQRYKKVIVNGQQVTALLDT
ncbi:zinc finger protein 232-like, partial [Pundamilia nyererei]|uniref:Zinc finger protein 232-like n=1 Tax=Pundamilia nyererei TaxID=303518 RepID=A0A9Y3S381_9CICH